MAQKNKTKQFFCQNMTQAIIFRGCQYCTLLPTLFIYCNLEHDKKNVQVSFKKGLGLEFLSDCYSKCLYEKNMQHRVRNLNTSKDRCRPRGYLQSLQASPPWGGGAMWRTSNVTFPLLTNSQV